MELGTEIVLGRRYPRAGAVLCDLRGTLSRETKIQFRKIDSRCSSEKEHTLERKSMPMVAWYMLSKESYINRVIKEVLPTIDHSSELAGETW